MTICTRAITTRIVLAILLVSATATTALAQSAGPPSFSIGDTWTRSNGQELTVVRVDGGRTVVAGVLRDCAACVSHYNNELQLLEVTDASGKPMDIMQVPGFVPLGSSWRVFDWPMVVGKAWSFSADGAFKGSVRPYNVDTTIAAYEEVKTKAGTFKAYKMQRSWSVGGRGARRSEWSDSLWYAPDVKSTIKFTSTNRNVPDWELASYSLK